MSTFAIGEVAIYNLPLALLHGAEVTVISELRHGRVYSNHSGFCRQEPYYLVDSPQFTAEERAAGPCAAPWQLRKRRPPQDWKQMCKLDEVPSDCVAEREVVT